MAFPQTPLDLRAELSLAGTWTDVSSYLYQRDGTQAPVTITRGRPDEAAQVNAGSCTFEANNRSGNWSPKNPLGAWYGKIGRNAPLRLSIPAQSNYLRMETDSTSYASTPDSAALSVTGSIDVQLDLTLTDWQPCTLAAKWNTSSDKSWALYLNGDGTLQWEYWDGTTDRVLTSTVPVPFTNGRMAVRAALVANNGSGGHQSTLYTAATIAGPWTQLGDSAVVSGTVSVFDSTAPVAVGYSAGYIVTDPHPGYTGPNGAISEFRLYNGISGSGGTLVADPVFSAQSAGTTSFSDGHSNTWTLNGTAEISSRNYRYHGELSSLPGKWDVTGTDISAPVTAGGLLRRIGQGQAPVMSPMKRAVLLQPGTLAPAAYWPCEDAAGATSLGSATGGPPMFAGSQVQLSSDSSFTASAPLPVLNGSLWHGRVPGYTSNGSVVLRFLFKLGSTVPNGLTIMRAITTGTAQEVSLLVTSSGFVQLVGNAPGGGSVFASGSITAPGGGSWSGDPLWVSIELTPSGGNVNVNLNILAPGSAQQAGVSIGSYAGVPGNVTDVYVSPRQAFTDTVIGHISVQSALVAMTSLQQPLNAWQGEAAGSRFARIAGENGYQARITGSPGQSALMGAQSIATLAQLLQECEDADGGQISEPRQALALGYRTLASMTNQAAAVTLDYAQAQPGGVSGDGSDGGLDPTYDDQLTRNDMTVTRSAGSISGATYQFQLNDGSAMSISPPPAGVGDYASTLSVNVQADAQLPDEAGWAVHVGTVDEARWPQIPLNLARTAVAGLYYTLAGCDIGDYAVIVNMLHQVTYDPVRQLLFQVKESLGGFHHTLEWTGVPESPYEVAIFDDAVYGRADTDGASLHSSATSGTTSLSVDTATGFPLWTTTAADFPFDIGIGGERMTVTTISGSLSSPQAFTVTRAVNGVVKAHSAGEDVRLWFPPVLALI